MNHSSTDILGEALLDFAAGGAAANIHVYSDIAERDDLPVAHFFRTFEQMPALERLALSKCTGRVADIGAGAGSHALVLQARNLNVTAFDTSPGACAVMRQRGVQKVEQRSGFDLTGGPYDTVLMLMNGIGLVQDLQGLGFFLAQIKKHLHPHGKIILDSSDISYMYYDEEGGLNLDLNAEYHGVVTYQMEYKLRMGEPFKWLFIDFPVLEDYAAEAGFKAEFLFEGEHYQYLAVLTLAGV